MPVQTSQNNFPTFQQPQMVTQQMQTSPTVPYPGNLQDTYKPFYQLRQSDVFVANHQYLPHALPPRNPGPPAFQPPFNIPPTAQTQPIYEPLPQNLLEPIRGCVNNVPPIFILPSSCHQTSNQAPAIPPAVVQASAFNSPPAINCPPSFYPYPYPLPIYEPPLGHTRDRDRFASCGCCHRRPKCGESKNHSMNSCCCSAMEQEEHRCTASNDDTICSKRNCPASISLQALASQFLALPGIISCAATRLILRKVPGSNITSSMEDTMDKAQTSINVLTKDQLLAESRNAQQVHALINLHMTTNPPANIIPLLTWLQIKVNVLKAQVESLINKKVMECQGYGYEVETSGPIDPAVLGLKTNAELRQLLSALRQKETDERVNANFSPYHSQRVIAEARLNTVQGKIRQVEAEFDNRRCASLPVPTPTITSRIIQQFAESRCTFGFAQTNLFEPYTPENVFESPDPFSQCYRNPRRLYLKPHVPEPITAGQKAKDESKGTSTSEDGVCKNKATGEESKGRLMERKSSTCSCDKSSSDESLCEDKKKLRIMIDERKAAAIHYTEKLKIVELKAAPNVVTVDVEKQALSREQCKSVECHGPTSSVIKKAYSEKSMKIHEQGGENEKIQIHEVKNSAETKKGQIEGMVLNSKIMIEPVQKVEIQQHVGVCKPDGPPCTQPTFVEFKSESLGSSDVSERMVISEDVPEQRKAEAIAEPLQKAEVRQHIDVCKQEGLPCTQPTSTDFESESSGSSDISEQMISLDIPKEQEIKDDTGSDQTFHESNQKKKGRRYQEEQRENIELLEKNGKENVHIVSIVTSIEYDRQLDFGSWMIVKNSTDKVADCERNYVEDSYKDTETESLIEESPERLSVNKINSSSMKSAMTNTNNKEYKNLNRTSILQKMFGVKPNSEDRVQNDGRTENEIRRFPPLGQKSLNRGVQAIGIAKNIFHRREIESDSSRTVYDGNTPYHRDTDTGNGIVSTIYSVIESQLVSFASLLGNIPNLQNFLSNYGWKGRSSGNENIFTIYEKIRNIKLSKQIFSRDWILLPESDRKNIFGNCVSVKECCNNARELRQSIIVDKTSRKYALIKGSISGQLRVLSKKGLERPNRVRRSLIIRSKLKSPENSELKCLRPFTILKRAKKDKPLTSYPAKKKKREFRSSKKFYYTPEILNNLERRFISNHQVSNRLINKKGNKVFVNSSQSILKGNSTGINSSCYNFVSGEYSLTGNAKEDMEDYFIVGKETDI